MLNEEQTTQALHRGEEAPTAHLRAIIPAPKAGADQPGEQHHYSCRRLCFIPPSTAKTLSK